MKVLFKETEEKTIDIRYICADLGVRYWEDAEINGEDDISYDEQETGAKPRVPLAVENPNSRYKDDKYRWVIKIDTETGNILGWPNGVTADIHYKVCDDGTYWLEGENGNKYHEIDNYVPKLFDFCNDSYGDYIIMTIDELGHIKEWYDKDELKSRIDSFLEDEGF